MNNPKLMIAVRPNNFQEYMDAWRFVTKNPLAAYVQKLENLLPIILNSSALSTSEKLSRYKRIMEKLNAIAESRFSGDLEKLKTEEAAPNTKAKEIKNRVEPLEQEFVIPQVKDEDNERENNEQDDNENEQDNNEQLTDNEEEFQDPQQEFLQEPIPETSSHSAPARPSEAFEFKWNPSPNFQKKEGERYPKRLHKKPPFRYSPR